ncbi:gliding motility-associated C-terminal domain-containing protein [Chryseobacterium sp. MEBOG07]|uniref:gliding motility-associated C-terminal domain-containing protein n=1 Tax=Chryseobacterium sp. MEBOG07 TaxID=2879939 RepID=UPI001F25CE73|nr:gliding motility-associated C-terminal domain-containing protein [Chryseobacterium sp. MEBOG07]UKB78615.1 gliding motility-associated C-terminal domain-containing protein [Chryseobacterium sp. MEBOG07]
MLLQCIKDKKLSTAGISMKVPAFIFILLLCSFTSKGSVLYWIGGSGNWSDINHWSLSSGNSGSVLSPSIPQAGDHVIFDGNSGFNANSKTVTINQESTCMSFTVKGVSQAPLFIGNILNIYGSADFQTGTVLNNTLYFRSGGTSTIGFNEQVTGSAAIYFLGSGSYLISGILKSTGKMYFLKGSLDFGSSVITTSFFDEAGCCGTIPSGVIEPRSLHLGSSIITLTGRNSQLSGSPSWNYTGNTLIGGTSQINITQGADDGYGVSFIGKNGQVYHNVSFTNTADPSNPSPYGWYRIAEGNCTFNHLSFANSGFITSNCTIDTLNLAKSKTYFVYGTQNVSVINNPTQDCEPLWSLSGYGAVQATIKSTLPIGLRNVRLNYLKAIGSALFSASNGIDGGQNSGWVFTNSSKNFYWIGGGGTWNDPAHWTTHADGTPSGGCLPSRNDNVFFTRFSGDISSSAPVIITTPDAECQNISWSGVPGNPVFKTAAPKDMLSIYGSSTWQKGMHYRVATTQYMSTETGNTLTSNGVEIQGDTYFLTSGGWSLNDAFSSPENDILFRNGHLNTNSQSMAIKNFGSSTSGLGVRTLTLANSTITVNGNWAYINYGGSPLFLNSGTSQINLSANSANFYYNSGLAYHNIAFTAGGSANISSLLYSTTTPCTFNSVTFAGSAFINAGGSPTPLTISDLHVSSSKKYILGTNMEVKVTHFKVIGPVCSGLLEIGSYLPGTRARLNLLTPTTIINAKLSDINASGSPLMVTGGIDGGNNLNVAITPALSRHFYWIGGSGNWSDPTHWTTDTKGIADPMNSCLPGAMDNVFFTKYSGNNYTVTLDISANCNNMTWEEVAGSQPVLKGLEVNPLNINGSLILQTGMDYDVERTNFVAAHSGNTITTNGVEMDYTAENVVYKGVFFNNTSGTWLLSDTFNVKNFGVLSGTFDTNNQTVNADNYSSTSGSSAVLNLGSSAINIAGYWDGAGISKLNAGTSTINMMGTMPPSNSSGGGVNNNEFRSKPGLVYNDLHFLNGNLTGSIIGYDGNTGNAFSTVNFNGESIINGSNQFNILTLGKDCHLMGGSIQTVNRLISNSSCKVWDFDNTYAASKATIKSTSNISLNKVRMSGIAVIGGAVYTATGINKENNSGWTFSAPTAQNLYWIDGSGNWNDPTHWTTNANGTSSGGCLPTRFDNVFFNEYSGESPKITITGIAEFHNMTWSRVTGTPTMGGTLACYGSLILQRSLSHTGGIQFLSSEAGSTITTNGAIVATQFDVQFSGTGSYTLLDDFTTNTRIRFTNGTLNTNGKTLKALSFTGIESNHAQGQSLSLILGASRIYLSYSGEGWSYTGSHLDAGTSHIYLTQSANEFKGKDGASYHTITFDGNDNLINRLYGSLIVDQLTFSSKNSIYQIEAGKTITINDRLQMSGTNCSTVQVQSTIEGIKANLCVNSGKTTYNFISLKDINASCLPFTLLPQSTNGGNTANINFQSNPGTGIGALGPDLKICAAVLPVVLDGSVFMPNENTKIQWTNLTTGEVLGDHIKQSVTSGGTYQIKVAYGPHCEVTDNIVISIDPVTNLAAQIKITQPTCMVTGGAITIKPTEGITYSVDGSTYSETLYYELPSGEHTITAKNSSGCISDPIIVTIHPKPLIPTATISYGNGKFEAAGTVDVIQTGQTGGTFSALPQGLSIDAATGTLNLAKSTPNQSYIVTYAFTNGTCNSMTTTIVKINPALAAIAYPLEGYCAVGTVKVQQTGPKNGRYTASPSGLKIDEVTGAIALSESAPGMYSVTYTYQDGSLLSKAMTGIMVNPLPLVTITSDPETEIIKGQTITLTASGGISYAWIGTEIQSGQNTETLKVSPSQTTTYTVIATNANGCTAVSELTITVKEDQGLIPNNVITPNGDGKNDTWIIKNIEAFPNNKVLIYDRAGRLLYSKKGYANDWDGILNGKLLHEDAYIYVIEPGNGNSLIRGTVSIIRDHP